VSFFIIPDTLDLFPVSKWATRSEAEYKEATEQFRAAVMVARSGNDDSIKQVFHFCFCLIATLYSLGLPIFKFLLYFLAFCIIQIICLASRPEMATWWLCLSFCCDFDQLGGYSI